MKFYTIGNTLFVVSDDYKVPNNAVIHKRLKVKDIALCCLLTDITELNLQCTCLYYGAEVTKLPNKLYFEHIYPMQSNKNFIVLAREHKAGSIAEL